jgi:hypothetical protein
VWVLNIILFSCVCGFFIDAVCIYDITKVLSGAVPDLVVTYFKGATLTIEIINSASTWSHNYEF